MLVVGLTGGIATGKSSVSRQLKGQDIPVVDADVIAREVVMPGTKGFNKIVQAFGEEIVKEDGTIDRAKLGDIIFNDPSKRKVLNGIVHPAVIKAMAWQTFWHWLEGARICVLDVPLLIEGGLWKYVGKVVVVTCPEDAQLSRLLSRDGSTPEAATARINSQKPVSEKLAYADYVVDNSGSKQDLERNIDTLVSNLKREVKWTWLLSWIFPPIGLGLGMWTVLFRLFTHRPG